MKITIETSDQDDERKLKLMLKAESMAAALFEIQQEILRPARKHGYSDRNISQFFNDSLPDKELSERVELVAALETRFYEIVHAHGINLDD